MCDVQTKEILVGTINANKEQNTADMNCKRSVFREIMGSLDDVVSHLPLRNPPQHVEANGYLTLTCDENKRIIAVELIIVY